MTIERVGPVRRMFVLLVLVAAAFAVGLLAVTEQARPSEQAREFKERWDGKWDTNYGNVKMFQDQREILGRWDCSCENGRPATIEGQLRHFGSSGEQDQTMDGHWRCGGDGGRGGFFIYANFDNKQRFKGWFWPKGDRSNDTKWVGDKE